MGEPNRHSRHGLLSSTPAGAGASNIWRKPVKKDIVKTGTAIAAFGALTFGSVAPAQATFFHPAPSHPVTSCSTYDPCKDGGSTGGGHTGGHTGGKDILGGLFGLKINFVKDVIDFKLGLFHKIFSFKH